MSDYTDRVLEIGISLQLAITTAATLYLLHLCRLALQRQHGALSARLAAAFAQVCDLRDVTQITEALAGAPKGAAATPDARMQRAIDGVLGLRLERLPTRGAVFAVAKAQSAATRLRDWARLQEDAVDWRQAPPAWRSLSQAANALHLEIDAFGQGPFDRGLRRLKGAVRRKREGDAPGALVSVKELAASGATPSPPAGPTVETRELAPS